MTGELRPSQPVYAFFDIHTVGYMDGGDGPGVGRAVHIPALGVVIGAGYNEYSGTRLWINNIHSFPPSTGTIDILNDETLASLNHLIEAKRAFEEAQRAFDEAKRVFIQARELKKHTVCTEADAGAGAGVSKEACETQPNQITKWLQPISHEECTANLESLIKETPTVINNIETTVAETGEYKCKILVDKFTKTSVKLYVNFHSDSREEGAGLPASIWNTINIGRFKMLNSRLPDKIHSLWLEAHPLDLIYDHDRKQLVSSVNDSDNFDKEDNVSPYNKNLKVLLSMTGGTEYFEQLKLATG